VGPGILVRQLHQRLLVEVLQVHYRQDRAAVVFQQLLLFSHAIPLSVTSLRDSRPALVRYATSCSPRCPPTCHPPSATRPTGAASPSEVSGPRRSRSH